MRPVFRIATGVLLLIVPVLRPAAAGPYEDGIAAYREQHYVTAMNFWRPLAEAGDTRAQANIGVLYRDAQGVPQGRTVEAYVWFSLAAAGGDKSAGSERDLLGRSMTAAQIADAKRRISEWKPAATSPAGPWK
jgi:TPR repeat protein